MPKFTEDTVEMVEIGNPKGGQKAQVVRRPVAQDVDTVLETHVEKRRAEVDAAANRVPAIARILIAIAALVISVIMVAIVSGSSGTSYKVVGGQSPRALVINIDQLSPVVLDYARASNKAPYINELITLGSAYASVQAGYSAPKGTPPTSMLGAQAALLTGVPESVTGITTAANLESMTNFTTFLRAIKSASLDVVSIVPEYTVSKATVVGNDTTATCTNVGIFDAECTGLKCPSSVSAPCSTSDIYTTSNTIEGGRVEDAIMSKTAHAMSNGKELIYIQLDSYAKTASKSEDLKVGLTNMASISEMYMVDAFVGRIAKLIASRTINAAENWLLIITSEGMNSAMKAPLVISVFSTGAPVALNPIVDANVTSDAAVSAEGTPVHAASTLDVLPTIAQWFDIALGYVSKAAYTGVSQAICAKGTLMKDGCVSTTASPISDEA